MVMVGGILLILGASLAFTNFLVDAQAPMKLFTFMQAHIGSRLVFLILLNIFLLVLGAILDIFSALVIMVPLILPVAMSYGVNPLHLGIVFLANMQIGYFTAARGHEPLHRQLPVRPARSPNCTAPACRSWSCCSWPS